MSFKTKVYNLMKSWCDELLKTQLDMPNEPLLDGALLCPGCAVVHGRCADMVLPLVLLYRDTGDEKYLTAAKKLIDWTEYNLLSEHKDYRNDLANRWKGTNIFTCLMLGETLHRFGDVLDAETFSKWDTIFRERAAAAIGFCETVGPHINYNAGAAAMFAFAYNYTGEQKFLEQAQKQEQFCREHFDKEGLFFGEGKPLDGTTAKGCHFIDMGYNLEESIPLLVLHALWMKDDEKIKYYTERAIDHLGFLLPDGATDNSWGTRQNKWTYWGSRTSDGMHEGFVYIAKDNPVIAKAVRRNIELLKRCTVDGRLYGGLMYHSAGEPACIHHAFDKVKSLAVLYLEMGDEFETCESAVLPREAEGVKAYQNGYLYTVTKGDFVATVNASDTHIYSCSETGGGAISMLWNKDYGAVMAATLNRFVTTEPMNMQIQRHVDEELCNTARIGRSDMDKTVELARDGYTITATSEQNGFEIEYDFTDDAVKINILSDKDTEYVLPIVSQSGDKVELRENEVVFKDMLSVSFNSEYTIDPADEKRHFHPVGGFQYKHLTFSISADKPLNIEIKINK
ncbi:MAG: hypothetical protein IJY79_01265 [Clostridia bacterium]|nr:hypothetical protein [Clostridia bacterium]